MSNCTLIGKQAGASLTTGTNNFFIGINAGYFLTTESNVTIIGDNITDLDSDNIHIRLGPDDHPILLGKTLFGKPLNLCDIIQGKLN